MRRPTTLAYRKTYGIDCGIRVIACFVMCSVVPGANWGRMGAGEEGSNTRCLESSSGGIVKQP